MVTQDKDILKELLFLTDCKNNFKGESGVSKWAVSLFFYKWSQHVKTNLEVQGSDATHFTGKSLSYMT